MSEPCPHVWGYFPALALTGLGPRGAAEPTRDHTRDLPRNVYGGRRERAAHSKSSGVQCCECARHVVTSGARYCAEHEPREDGEA